MSKNLLITWWLWYIGSHAVVAFEEAWYKTIIVDNLDNSDLSTLGNVEKILWYKPDFFEVDIRDVEKMEEIFKKYNFDWVVHFAWLKAVWESCKKPLKYFDNNVVGSIKLFELMQRYEVKNLIFSSSATVYNWENLLPYEENMSVWKTSNPYWTTKFLIEKILEDLARFSGFRVVNLRYFNPIWAHHSGLIWENPEWIPNNLFPFIMKVVSWELPELKVFWGDYDTKDGTGIRDYIDINDLVEGHLRAYELLEKWQGRWYLNDSISSTEWQGLFETFNLGVWKGVSVLELVKVCEEIIWKKIPYEIVPRRAGDLAEVYCNPNKAKEILGWETKVSIEESVKNGLRFMEMN